VGIVGNLTFFQFDTVLHEVIDAVNKFEFISRKGTIGPSPVNPNRFKDFYYQELNEYYAFQLDVVPKQKGIYAIYISNLLSNGLRGKDCTKASFSNTLNNSNKNIHLFEYAMNRPPASQYEIERIYCFRVQ
jgi:hypothetical protein